MHMEGNTSPGSDGFPVEFYKVFWNVIATAFVNAINCSFQKGQLSVTQKKGVISLLPKKDKTTLFVKKKFSFLNCDYKIASKR